MKSTYLLYLLVFLPFCTIAQDFGPNNLYTQQNLILTPAHTGDKGNLNLFFNSLTRWNGIDGSPKNLYFGIHSPINDQSAIGLMAVSQTEALLQNQWLAFSYSHKISLNTDNHLTFGLDVGVFRRSINTGGLGISDPRDPNISSDVYNRTSFASRFGLTYTWKELSVDAVLPSLISADQNHLKNAYTLISWYKMVYENQIKLQPSILAHATYESPFSYDINLMATWRDQVWLQPTYRSNQNLMIALGLNIYGLSIGYAYEAYRGTMNQIASGANEISLSFNFGSLKKSSKNQIAYTSQIPLDSAMNDHNKKIGDMNDRLEKLLTNQDGNNKEIKKLQDDIEQLKPKQEPQKLIKKDSVVSYKNEKMVGFGSNSTDAIEHGFYVVIHTFNTKETAQNALDLFKANMFVVNAAYNKENGLYYIYPFKSKDKQAAFDKMKAYRMVGFKDAWVYEF